jgi:integrase
VRSIKLFAAVLALAVAALVYQLSSARIFDDDEHPVFPEYERGLDMALLAGVTVRRDRKTPSPLQGVLPLMAAQPPDLDELHHSGALTGDPGGGKFPGPQFLDVGADFDMRTQVLTQSAFQEAAAAWLESRRPYISDATQRDYTIYIRTLSAFFSEMRLGEISADQIRAYQRARLAKAQWNSINKETSVLQQMLKRIGRWVEIAHDFQPLPQPKKQDEIGRCISDEEESRFFRVALSDPAWCVAAWASLISINTAAGPGEMLHLRLADIDLTQKMTMRITPEGAKNRRGRVRVVPLTDAAMWAVKQFKARAEHDCGCTHPEHYLIPFPVARNTYDPTRPQAHYYRGFNAILAAAGLDFRPYDFRHTAITRLLENPDVPLEVARSIVGHISEKMIRRYFHGRLSAQRSAVVAALARKPPESVKKMLEMGTKNVSG